MRKTGGHDKAQSLGEAIRELLSSYRLSTKFDETQLINSWERMAGKPIARRTRKLYIRDRVLFVELDSPAMRQDFTLHKSRVLDLLKAEFGAGIITDIVVM